MRKFIALIALLILLLASACSRTIYIPTEHLEVRTDTLRLSSVSSDTVYLHDKVFVAMKGDTVFIRKNHYRTKISVIHDTVYRTRNDTVRISESSKALAKAVASQASKDKSIALPVVSILLILALGLSLYLLYLLYRLKNK